MVAEDFVRDPQMRKWLDGVVPAWTLLTFDTSKIALSDAEREKKLTELLADDKNSDKAVSKPDSAPAPAK